MRGKIVWTILLVCVAGIGILAGCGGSAVATASKNPTETAPVPGGNSPNAIPANASTIPDIQNRKGWQDCSAKTPGGAPCASGDGVADAWMAQFQTTPSLSGSSAEFHVGGGIGYSNSLWWNQLAPERNASEFAYDFWVFMKDSDRPQALEFDVNQTIDGTRWVFGTECDFDGSGKWNVWNGAGDLGSWVPSGIGCAHFTPNTWTHVVWRFERSGTQVHYVSVTINDTEYPVDVWGGVQTNPNANELNVAVQLDGNHAQEPYEVWIDKVKLMYW